MAFINIKDAYYSVAVPEKYKKYIEFYWKENFYKFTCFPYVFAPGNSQRS